MPRRNKARSGGDGAGGARLRDLQDELHWRQDHRRARRWDAREDHDDDDGRHRGPVGGFEGRDSR